MLHSVCIHPVINIKWSPSFDSGDDRNIDVSLWNSYMCFTNPYVHGHFDQRVSSQRSKRWCGFYYTALHNTLSYNRDRSKDLSLAHKTHNSGRPPQGFMTTSKPTIKRLPNCHKEAPVVGRPERGTHCRELSTGLRCWAQPSDETTKKTRTLVLYAQCP